MCTHESITHAHKNVTNFYWIMLVKVVILIETLLVFFIPVTRVTERKLTTQIQGLVLSDSCWNLIRANQCWSSRYCPTFFPGFNHRGQPDTASLMSPIHLYLIVLGQGRGKMERRWLDFQSTITFLPPRAHQSW